jgi:hypothetical protein
LEDHSELNPRKTGESEYQQRFRAVLDHIAAWQPRPVHCVSETAMTVAATREAGDFKTNRDLIHAAFEMLQDRGFVVRESGVWRFTRPFTQANADDLSQWDGLFMPGPDLSRRTSR